MESLKLKLNSKDEEIVSLKEQIDYMEGEMRQFTSLAGLDENDESFEAVLRQEF